MSANAGSVQTPPSHADCDALQLRPDGRQPHQCPDLHRARLGLHYHRRSADGRLPGSLSAATAAAATVPDTPLPHATLTAFATTAVAAAKHGLLGYGH